MTRFGQVASTWTRRHDGTGLGLPLAIGLTELHGGTLTISGERKGESNNGETAQRTERYVGTFRRSIALPTRVDASKVSATYHDGILKVTLPKAEEAKPKQIQVS